MNLLHNHLFTVLWLGWALYWWLLSRNVKAVKRMESTLSRLMHAVPLTVAALMLWVPSLHVSMLDARFIQWSEGAFWVGAALTLSGLLFAVWARHHIGRNWSGSVTLKEGHELVTSGPYRFVRHPIYSGLLLAFVGSALARGEWRGVLAVIIVFLSLWRKFRHEERWMREQFGAQYTEYSRQVSALIPLVF